MTGRMFGAAAAALMMTCTASAQTPIEPQTRTVVTPVAPPTTVVTPVAPGEILVTPVPGVTMATKVKVQKFSDYDRNGDGEYNPMEFAQAIYFLATTDPVAGNPRLPSWDRYSHRGAPERMRPGDAVILLNATADELVIADQNNDWRVTPQEMMALAML